MYAIAHLFLSTLQLPRDVPMVIYSDAQTLDWTDEEREMLADVKPDVTGELSGGVHFRPYGPDSLLLLWEFFHHDMKVHGVMYV